MRRNAAVCAVAVVLVAAAAESPHEVWAIDQSNSPGKSYGGKVYIYDGDAMEARPERAQPEVIDLGAAASELCFNKTGANPVRPHMLAFNAAGTHAVISFVASGHVLFLNALTREPLECIRTTPGAGGARQVHFAIPSPDQTYVVAANQNGKLLERIDTDYRANRFTLNPAAMIDLANCTTPNGLPCQEQYLRPDNAPICPVVDSSSRLVFVTLRGGGLFVVNGKTTPMRIVAEYDRYMVHPNGCLGAEARGKMYVDSGGGTAGNLYEADLYAFTLGSFQPSSSHPPSMPPPTVVFSEDVVDADTHGAALVENGKYLWIADRGRNFIYVLDTEMDQVVYRIPLAGSVSSDPTPDLLFPSPGGTRVYISLRGPTPLTADPHVSMGTTPGVGVVRVTEGGRNGDFLGRAPISNRDGAVERADIHALAVRRK